MATNNQPLQTDIQEVAFAYVTEPRENLSGKLEWTIALNVPVTAMQQFEDAALAEIAEQQKAWSLSQAHPFRLAHPLERQLQERRGRHQDQG